MLVPCGIFAYPCRLWVFLWVSFVKYAFLNLSTNPCKSNGLVSLGRGDLAYVGQFANLGPAGYLAVYAHVDGVG